VSAEVSEARATGRHPNWGALPPKAELERMFLGGMSYAQIAKRYGVGRPQTVLTTMKRRARREGTPWPLKRDNHIYRQQRRLSSHPRWDSVTTVMIRAEIHDACKNLGITKRDIIRRSGVGERTIYQVSSGARDRISRTTAHKIMAAIEQLEQSVGRGDNTAGTSEQRSSLGRIAGGKT
jgi:transposase